MNENTNQNKCKEISIITITSTRQNIYTKKMTFRKISLQMQTTKTNVKEISMKTT